MPPLAAHRAATLARLRGSVHAKIHAACGNRVAAFPVDCAGQRSDAPAAGDSRMGRRVCRLVWGVGQGRVFDFGVSCANEVETASTAASAEFVRLIARDLNCRSEKKTGSTPTTRADFVASARCRWLDAMRQQAFPSERGRAVVGPTSARGGVAQSRVVDPVCRSKSLSEWLGRRSFPPRFVAPAEIRHSTGTPPRNAPRTLSRFPRYEAARACNCLSARSKRRS